ncbi:isochorismatase family protein [Venenivibrio stagnispumantis]|uniref:Nicotinamidase-related amidase n=1 Tax=Venenivibrio stagnispumantis TaxID=407998 RepID=A0AA45WME3_9AQUI|nr:hydrolase [Venenivibrio stagnispumantis]MCW4572794.1 hydrolase [Venenivibrio stagnispumantis]SMP13767.1 Nicotinamidase-related amidase [Venenivibrio stagnispumantis]
MLDKYFLDKEDVALIIIDIQDKLASVMEEREKVINNTVHLIELSKMMNIPISLTEQYPKGLGKTVPEIQQVLPEYNPIEKLSFNCCNESDFENKIKQINRKKLILTGMETHICVLQTALELLKMGYIVHIVADAVCSRSKENKEIALRLLQDAGTVITCTETILFQILKVAGTEEFKIISKRIK